MSEGVRLTTTDGLATVRMSAARGNAINDALIDGLMEAFGRAEADEAVGGVLLATGNKLFCPGLDLQHLVSFDRREMDRFMTRFGSLLLQMYTFPKPVVAALAGHALAGGMILSLTADWRVLRIGARVGLAELRVGVPLPFGVTMMLREAVMGPRLEEVALFGRDYEGDDAVAAGLVHETRPQDDLEDHCRDRLQEMATKDARAFATTKRYLRAFTVERIRAYNAQFQGEFLDCWFSDGTRARVRSLVEELRGRGEPS